MTEEFENYYKMLVSPDLETRALGLTIISSKFDLNFKPTKRELADFLLPNLYGANFNELLTLTTKINQGAYIECTVFNLLQLLYFKCNYQKNLSLTTKC